MSNSFANIGLVGRGQHDSALDTLQRLLQLLEGRGLVATLEKRLSKLVPSGSFFFTLSET